MRAYTAANNSTGSQASLRYTLLAILFAAIALAIIGRVVQIQFSPDADAFRELQGQYEIGFHMYYPTRGAIYDRWGSLLAGSRQVYEVGVDRNLVRDPEAIAIAMNDVMKDNPAYREIDYFGDVFRVASWEMVTGTNYAVIADFVTEAELAKIRAWAQRYDSQPEPKDKNAVRPSMAGVVYRPRLQRIYPEDTSDGNSLAASILGFVNWNGEGVFGVEEAYNQKLAGDPVAYLININPNKAPSLPRIAEGSSLILTIDRQVQMAVEEILAEAIVETGAEAGTVVVMNPRDGEIYAMASIPTINLNEYWKSKDIWLAGAPLNRAVSHVYEPGSVFKIFTMAAALDSGMVTPTTVFNDTGVVYMGGIPITNWDLGAHGPVTMTECMQLSLNVCLASLARDMGANTFYEYLRRFGMGQATEIDLAGEEVGLLRLPGFSNWYESDLGTNSFGQGIAVTPIQMMQAASALANDGQMVLPHIMRSEITNGRQYTPARIDVGSPVTAETARTLTEMLAVSLEKESSDALVSGYRVSGKTGTAQIATPSGYSLSVTNASFIGWGPADDPQLLIYVWLEKPSTSIWGSVVAAPVFSKVFQQTALLMNIPTDEVRHQMANR